MPSYAQYKRQIAVLDDDNDIESWITVKGNHIPIRKGQSKEEAVKSFLEKKSGKESTKVNITKKGITEKYDDVAGKRDALIKELKNKDLTPKERYNKEREKSKLEKIMVAESEKGTIERKRAELAKERGESVKYSDSKEKKETKSDSPMVNAVAKALNKPVDEAEKEVEGAVQYIKDLIKAKDLRNGDVEETLQGLGIESDYAEEFMQWVSHPSRKKSQDSAIKTKWSGKWKK